MVFQEPAEIDDADIVLIEFLKRWILVRDQSADFGDLFQLPVNLRAGKRVHVAQIVAIISGLAGVLRSPSCSPGFSPQKINGIS